MFNLKKCREMMEQAKIQNPTPTIAKTLEERVDEIEKIVERISPLLERDGGENND